MAIPYRTAKFKSANTFKTAIWDPTAKFNSCQYFQLYGILQSFTPTAFLQHFKPREGMKVSQAQIKC